MKNLMKLCGRGLVASLLALVLCAGAVQAQVNAYVTNGFSSNTISVIDTATNTVTATVPVGASPLFITIDPLRRLAYVGTASPDTVTVIDLVTNTVVAVVPTAGPPLAVALSANGDFAYVAFGGNSTVVTVIATATNTVVTDLPVVGEGAFALVLAPDGSMWSSDFNGVVSVIDTATHTITSTFATGGPWLDAAFTPDGAFAYLSGYYVGNTSVLDVATKTVVATIPTGTFGFRTAITPDGAFVYEPAPGNGGIFVIDTATNTVAATIPVLAYSVAITPDGAFAYVATVGDSVEVIATATNTVVATVPVVGAFDIAIAGQATPQDQIASLIAEINALVTGGALAPNKANPLITKLEKVSDKLDGGQTNAACGQLGAFINQVNAYIGNRTLTAAQGQALIDATNAIRANLGC